MEINMLRQSLIFFLSLGGCFVINFSLSLSLFILTLLAALAQARCLTVDCDVLELPNIESLEDLLDRDRLIWPSIECCDAAPVFLKRGGSMSEQVLTHANPAVTDTTKQPTLVLRVSQHLSLCRQTYLSYCLENLRVIKLYHAVPSAKTTQLCRQFTIEWSSTDCASLHRISSSDEGKFPRRAKRSCRHRCTSVPDVQHVHKRAPIESVRVFFGVECWCLRTLTGSCGPDLMRPTPDPSHVCSDIMESRRSERER